MEIDFSPQCLTMADATTDNKGSQSFQVTLSRSAYAYLGYLCSASTLGGTVNTIAANILSTQIEKMRLSGDYSKEIPPFGDGSNE